MQSLWERLRAWYLDTIWLLLDPVERIERQSRPVRQPVSKYGFAASGIAKYGHPCLCRCRTCFAWLDLSESRFAAQCRRHGLRHLYISG